MTKKTITIEQFGSVNRRPERQVQTLRGLGLDKLNRRRTVEDTPAIRGMLAKVQHVVRIVEEK